MYINKYKNQAILIVGGGGFIGSHLTLHTKQAGFTPIVLDKHIPNQLSDIICIKGDMQDESLLLDIFKQYPIFAVLHLAGYISVSESIQDPLKYYKNNVSGTIVLLQAMLKANINNIIFSSSASVYGSPRYVPIDESHPLNPINPYGKSKLICEGIIKDTASTKPLNYIMLRYFNAAGADPHAGLYEDHEPETHLIPLILQTALGMKPHIEIYGNDYETVDGTCVRDYIHVKDLAHAHLLALNLLIEKKQNHIFNLGTGFGYSVQQIIETAKSLTQRPIPVKHQPRRLGDPPILIANPNLALQQLGWNPQYSSLQQIISDAWASNIKLRERMLLCNTKK